MTLNGHYALCFQNARVFGAHRENLKINCLAWTLVFDYITYKVFADIRGVLKKLCKLSLDLHVRDPFSLGGHLRHFFLGSRATAQCDLR